MDNDSFIIINSRNSQTDIDNNKSLVPSQQKSNEKNTFKNVYTPLLNQHNQFPYFDPEITTQKTFIDETISHVPDSAIQRSSAPFKLEAGTQYKNYFPKTNDSNSDRNIFLQENNMSFEQYKLRNSLLNEPQPFITNFSQKVSNFNKPPRYSSGNFPKTNEKKDNFNKKKFIEESKVSYNIGTTSLSEYRQNKSKELISVINCSSTNQIRAIKEFDEFSIKSNPTTSIEKESMVSSKSFQFDFSPLGFEVSSEKDKKPQSIRLERKEIIDLSIKKEPKPLSKKMDLFQENSIKKHKKSDDLKKLKELIDEFEHIDNIDSLAINKKNEINIGSEIAKRDDINPFKDVNIVEENEFEDHKSINFLFESKSNIDNIFQPLVHIQKSIEDPVILMKCDDNKEMEKKILGQDGFIQFKVDEEIKKETENLAFIKKTRENLVRQEDFKKDSLIKNFEEKYKVVDQKQTKTELSKQDDIISSKIDIKNEIFKQNTDGAGYENIKAVDRRIINEPELLEQTKEMKSSNFFQDSTENFSEIADLTYPKIESQEKTKKVFLPRRQNNQTSSTSLYRSKENIKENENNDRASPISMKNLEDYKREEEESLASHNDNIYDELTFTSPKQYGLSDKKYFKSVRSRIDSISENSDSQMIQLEGLGCVIISGPDESNENSILDRRFTENVKSKILIPQEEFERIKSSTVLIKRLGNENEKANYYNPKISKNLLNTYKTDQSFEINNEENNQNDVGNMNENSDRSSFADIRLSMIKIKETNEKKSFYPAFKNQIYLGNDKELIKRDNDLDIDNQTFMRVDNKSFSIESKTEYIDRNASVQNLKKTVENHDKYNEKKSAKRSTLKNPKDQNKENEEEDKVRDSCSDACTIF